MCLWGLLTESMLHGTESLDSSLRLYIKWLHFLRLFLLLPCITEEQSLVSQRLPFSFQHISALSLFSRCHKALLFLLQQTQPRLWKSFPCLKIANFIIS